MHEPCLRGPKREEERHQTVCGGNALSTLSSKVGAALFFNFFFFTKINTLGRNKDFDTGFRQSCGSSFGWISMQETELEFIQQPLIVRDILLDQNASSPCSKMWIKWWNFQKTAEHFWRTFEGHLWSSWTDSSIHQLSSVNTYRNLGLTFLIS